MHYSYKALMKIVGQVWTFGLSKYLNTQSRDWLDPFVNCPYSQHLHCSHMYLEEGLLMLMKLGHPCCLFQMLKHFDRSTYQHGAQHLQSPKSFSSGTPSRARKYILIMTHHNIHPNNESQTRPLLTLTFFASVRVNQFHTPVYPLRITSRNIPENFPKSLPHNVHNASSIHSPLPSCCRQESRTSSATRSNVKISFLTRIP